MNHAIPLPWLVAAALPLAVPANAGELLIHHDIRTDPAGNILPWYDDDPGKSYDHVLGLVWKFWDGMRTDMNGLPYYMNHQVWRPDANDPRGIAGGEFEMAMCSWRLYYMYSGNERVRENWRFIADYYLTHGLSPSDSRWPNLPFPYNTLVYSGVYDGDMIVGRGYLQPDKAGAFGNELVKLARSFNVEGYPHATDSRYWQAAVAIADTLAAHVGEGDADCSPLPFKVNAHTGEVGPLLNNNRDGRNLGRSAYSTNWAGTLELFEQLIERKMGRTADYERASATILEWMRRYPMKTNRWGPFFEDIPGWSDTQTNAMTWARYIMDHRERFPAWKAEVQGIVDWVYETLANREWEHVGVTAINEQTAYRVPGNSHTSRQAADELYFAALTGDHSRRAHAIRQLNWATYMVDHDGRNRYPRDEIWMSDGYGDYVRHYLRAMAAWPELAPAGQTHLLSSTSVVQEVGYRGTPDFSNRNHGTADAPRGRVMAAYVTDQRSGLEVLRVPAKPTAVYLGRVEMRESLIEAPDSYTWRAVGTGGILLVRRENGDHVTVVE